MWSTVLPQLRICFSYMTILLYDHPTVPKRIEVYFMRLRLSEES